MFLWHFPAGFPGWELPTALPFGVRTFLEGYLPRDRVDPRGDLKASAGRPSGRSPGRRRRVAAQLSSEPQATQPSACSDRSPQTGQPATPALRRSPIGADDDVLERPRADPEPGARPPRRSPRRGAGGAASDVCAAATSDLPEDADHLAEDLGLAGDDRLVGVVLGLQADGVALAEEPLHGRLVLDHRDDDLAVVGVVGGMDDDVVAAEDAGVLHRVARTLSA